MLRLGKMTDYSVVVLIYMSDRQDDLLTAPDISQATGLSAPTVAKILKNLSRSDLLQSQRGAHGGYRLLKPLQQISVADVIQIMEGPITLVNCVEVSNSACDLETCCPINGRWDPVNQAIWQTLSNISLKDLNQNSSQRFMPHETANHNGHAST